MTDVMGPIGPPRPSDDEEPERVTEIGPPEPVDRERHPIATTVGVISLALVALVALVALGDLMSTQQEPGRQVAEIVVPRMSGRTLQQAQEQLERLGLIVDVRYEPNEIVAVDVVVDQEPIAGARLEVGEQVVLVVSDGPAGVRVPEFTGVSAAESVRLLQALGLVGVIEEVYDEDVPQGDIVGSIPAARARALPGSEVRVLVSKGPEPRTVPDLVGQPSPEAFVALGRAELEVGRITKRTTSDAPPGTVLSTTPAAGEQAPRSYPVALVIAAAPRAIDTPDLVGFTRNSASRIASDLGLKVSVSMQTVSEGDRRAGRVIAQTPVANSPLGGGGTVNITVGAAPPPPTTTTTTVPGGSTTTSTTAPRR